MPVLDASVLVAFIAGGERAEEADEFLAANRHQLHAPQLIDVEAGHALRRLVSAEEIAPQEGDLAIADLAGFPLNRFPHHPLLELAWSLRERVSFYDAVYLALGIALDEPVVTLDARLVRGSDGLGVTVTLPGAS